MLREQALFLAAVGALLLLIILARLLLDELLRRRHRRRSLRMIDQHTAERRARLVRFQDPRHTTSRDRQDAARRI